VITDTVKSSVVLPPQIADHRAILIRLPFPEISEVTVARTVWLLKKADWNSLEEELGKIHWDPLQRGTAEDALNYFLDVLWTSLLKHIPRKAIQTKHSSHPWLNSRCREAIALKNASEGTDAFPTADAQCSQVLREERAKYVEKLKAKLVSLPRSSKQWWRINRELLHRKAKPSSIPPMRDGSAWILDAKAKADIFATNFASKSRLPPEVVDTPYFGTPAAELDEFIPLRTRTTKNILKKLVDSKATGHDQISATILKRLSGVLAQPFTRICRRLLYEGCWPKIWKLHMIVPIYKRGSAFNAGNYRGVHLTSILSKVAERLVGSRLVPFLQQNAFGSNQWAFSTGLGSKDLVTMLVMSWILGICTGHKIGAYLSDISGAFDRVFKAYLLAKLHASGIGPIYLNFLDAYLSPRKGKVVVQGEASDPFTLEDTVFQGTVLGPPLWNVFFADVATPASATGGHAAMFADDLNVFQLFELHAPIPEVEAELAQCRTRVHTWGRANRVAFDPSKEHLVILHPDSYHGESFKLLGLMMDLDLRMHTAVDQLLAKIRAKSTAILRTRGYYNTADLINQYKTHIWGLVEVHCGGYFHAATGLLDKIGRVQHSFLWKLQVSEQSAFLDFNFAPTKLRRNIGILGLLHKRVLGKCHRSFEKILPWYSQRFDEPRAFGHSKQLYDHSLEVTHQRALFQRSIFPMIDIYNNLPQQVVDAQSVAAFQGILTGMAKDRCQRNDPLWAFSFDRRSGPDLSGPVIA